MALTDNVALMTALANDSHYENIFSEQLANFARPEDVAFAISASGNSANVLKALNAARQARLVTAGLTGGRGWRILALGAACLVSTSQNMPFISDLQLHTLQAF